MTLKVTIVEEVPGVPADQQYFVVSRGVEKVRLSGRATAWSKPISDTFYFPNSTTAKAWAAACGFGYRLSPFRP